MTTLTPERDAFDAAGMPIRLRPYATLVAVRVLASPYATGLSPVAHASLKAEGIKQFWLERDAALGVIGVLARELRVSAPWRAIGTSAWAADADVPLARVERRLVVLQDRMARVEAFREFAGALASRLALAGTVFLVASLSARFADAIGAPAAFGLIAPGALALLVARKMGTTRAERWLGFLAFEALALAPFPHDVLERNGALAASALAFAALQWRLHVELLPDLRPPEVRADCPHVHYSGAHPPSAYPNCLLLEGSAFRNIEAKWEELRGYWMARERDDTEPRFVFGGFRWPFAFAAESGLILGSSGSGKSLTLLAILKGLAPRLLTVVYDHKRTLYPSLVGAMPGGADEVALLNPTDKRGLAWHVARDIRNWLLAVAFADSITASEKREDYWVREARTGIAALIMSLNAVRGENWSLLDLIQAANPKHIREVLALSPEGRNFLDTALTSNSRVGDRPGDVLATISSLLNKLLPIALAAEEHFRAGRTFAVTDWARGATRERCIVFAHNPLYAPAFEALNPAICERVAAELLGTPGRFDLPRALVVIDELQAAPALPVEELLTNGREKGVTVWMASQDVPGIAVRYGSRDKADAIIGGVRSQAFLRTSDNISADKASALAGSQTFVRELSSTQWSESSGVSRNYSPEGGSSGTNRSWTRGGSTTPSVHTEKLLPPHVLLNLPPPGPESGLVGYFRRDQEQWFPAIHWQWVLDQIPKRAPIPDEDPIAVDALAFRPWTRADLADFLGEPGEDFFRPTGEGEGGL